MLTIRMQRTGRKGHAMFRVVVQDSRVTPTSGKIVAQLGSYDPHAKTVTLDKDKASFYLDHGAQPSDRAVRILQAEGVALPAWVASKPGAKTRTVRNADKRRSTAPAAPKEEAAPAADVETPVPDEPVIEESTVEAPEVDESPAESTAEPAETSDAPEADVPAA